MEKLKMQTPDLAEQNIEKIAQIFPHVITEIQDENGAIVKAVDFNSLKQELSEILVEEGEERYRLDWPGKKASILKANTPIKDRTLRPIEDESVDFNKTENLFVEGDNFEVLKLLQESYLSKVKMIYIDPPYNTGQDFVYGDNYSRSKEEYDEESGAIDRDGNRLFKNTSINGRFHSDWLSMMYERLVIAKDLLSSDGVIFISIDDHEQDNLKKICNEIFGEENFIANVVWQSRTSISNDQEVSLNHNHTFIYSKNRDQLKFYGEPLNEAEYSNPDNDPRGPWKLVPLDANKVGGDTVYPIINPKTNKEYLPPNGRIWAINRQEYKKLYDDGRIKFGKNDDSAPKKKLFLRERLEKGDAKTPSSLLLDAGTTQTGTIELMSIFDGKKIFDYPKPSSLIKRLLYYGSCDKDIIMDFFAGSCSTADAVMQLNAEENGKRKFIMVQLPEETDKDSEAYKAGYKTIADIAKERIRRAAKKIQEDNKDKDLSGIDFGFRVYKTDSTNMKDVYYNPNKLNQELLFGLESNIKEDRSPEDLLTQVILDLGLELSLKIEKKDILGNKVFFIADNSLVACFDEEINIDIVDEIAKINPLKVVFRDAGFVDDKDRINVEERFKRLSPETKVRVI